MDIVKDLNLKNDVFLLKFDDLKSKYDLYFKNLNIKVVNITDPEIIKFYNIEIIPTIYFYKNNNIIDILTGFYPKTNLELKIKNFLN